MFTLILPTFSRSHIEPNLDFQTPALNHLCRFGQFDPTTHSTGDLYLHYLCGRFTLPENEVLASPVWLQMGMNNMNMTDGTNIDIGMGEAQSLCDGLNEFYRHEFVFEPIRADLWRLKLPEPALWESPMVFDVWGFQAGDFSEQAQGEQRNEWLQLQTEIQMWLHEHPMNKVRQKNGQPPINGIWLWQMPTLRELAHTPALLGSNSSWVAQSSLKTHDAPYSLSVWQKICDENQVDINETALFLDDLTASAQTNDAYAYHQIIHQWETHFFAPIVAALKSGTLPEMRLICEDGILTLNRRSHWAFWKTARTFSGKLA